MNIRKPVDYSMMYASIDAFMVSNMEQTKLFCEIGRLIDERTEKGAAVAAAEYINATFPEKSGFSPRSLRRMRDFYRAYKADPCLMARAMEVSWTLNAVIIESFEEHDVRKWYVLACLKYGWSKQELLGQIKDKAHENTELICDEAVDQDSVEHERTGIDMFSGSMDASVHSKVKERGAIVKRTLLPNKGPVYDFLVNAPQFIENTGSWKKRLRELFFRTMQQEYWPFLARVKRGMGVRITLPMFKKITGDSCLFGELNLLAGCSSQGAKVRLAMSTL